MSHCITWKEEFSVKQSLWFKHKGHFNAFIQPMITQISHVNYLFYKLFLCVYIFVCLFLSVYYDNIYPRGSNQVFYFDNRSGRRDANSSLFAVNSPASTTLAAAINGTTTFNASSTSTTTANIQNTITTALVNPTFTAALVNTTIATALVNTTFAAALTNTTIAAALLNTFAAALTNTTITAALVNTFAAALTNTTIATAQANTIITAAQVNTSITTALANTTTAAARVNTTMAAALGNGNRTDGGSGIVVDSHWWLYYFNNQVYSLYFLFELMTTALLVVIYMHHLKLVRMRDLLKRTSSSTAKLTLRSVVNSWSNESQVPTYPKYLIYIIWITNTAIVPLNMTVSFFFVYSELYLNAGESFLASNQHSYLRVWLTLNVNLLNSLLVAVDFAISAIPVRVYHAYVPAAYALSYIVFIAVSCLVRSSALVSFADNWREYSSSWYTFCLFLALVAACHVAHALAYRLKFWLYYEVLKGARADEHTLVTLKKPNADGDAERVSGKLALAPSASYLNLTRLSTTGNAQDDNNNNNNSNAFSDAAQIHGRTHH